MTIITPLYLFSQSNQANILYNVTFVNKRKIYVIFKSIEQNLFICYNSKP